MQYNRHQEQQLKILVYNSGDIIPDQVTPVSDVTPLADSGTGVAGTSNEYSREDHRNPLQVSTSLPSKDTSVGTIGTASSYAKSDHQHPIQTVDTIPISYSADGSYATSHEDGLRISRSATVTGNSSIQLEYSRTSNTGLIEGQWEIFTPPNTAKIIPYGFIIAVASQAGDNTRGIQISTNGNTLTFNGNGLVDVGTIGNNAQNPLGFTIVKAGQEGQVDRGLQISADRNTLTFNGIVL
ncbi:MAG: hypothetical protein EZS28_029961 [Streblomastix strix]|uniref:Uncharacterized protein n=1 Tax=Streblomastix strix TaxID=222440 RepID=A0A5J4UW24_9EUKA|nr:MAG: hypothetical protein EZS28_029961 [Streblomastix strix]